MFRVWGNCQMAWRNSSLVFVWCVDNRPNFVKAFHLVFNKKYQLVKDGQTRSKMILIIKLAYQSRNIVLLTNKLLQDVDYEVPWCLIPFILVIEKNEHTRNSAIKCLYLFDVSDSNRPFDVSWGRRESGRCLREDGFSRASYRKMSNWNLYCWSRSLWIP